MIAIVNLDILTAGTLWHDFKTKGVEARRYRTGADFLADGTADFVLLDVNGKDSLPVAQKMRDLHVPIVTWGLAAIDYEWQVKALGVTHIDDIFQDDLTGRIFSTADPSTYVALVADDARLRFFLSNTLKSNGFNVQTYSSTDEIGPAGCALCVTSDHPRFTCPVVTISQPSDLWEGMKRLRAVLNSEVPSV